MKILLCLVCFTVVMFASQVYAADLKGTYTIPDANVIEDVRDYVYVHKNTEVDANGDLIYTDEEWMQEHIVRYIQGQVKRGAKVKDRDGYSPKDVSHIKK